MSEPTELTDWQRHVLRMLMDRRPGRLSLIEGRSAGRAQLDRALVWSLVMTDTHVHVADRHGRLWHVELSGLGLLLYVPLPRPPDPEPAPVIIDEPFGGGR